MLAYIPRYTMSVYEIREWNFQFDMIKKTNDHNWKAFIVCLYRKGWIETKQQG